jgi:hypothetical protein
MFPTPKYVQYVHYSVRTIVFFDLYVHCTYTTVTIKVIIHQLFSAYNLALSVANMSWFGFGGSNSNDDNNSNKNSSDSNTSSSSSSFSQSPMRIDDFDTHSSSSK